MSRNKYKASEDFISVNLIRLMVKKKTTSKAVKNKGRIIKKFLSWFFHLILYFIRKHVRVRICRVEKKVIKEKYLYKRKIPLL